MRDKMENFFKNMYYGLVFLIIYLLPTFIAILPMKMVAAVLTFNKGMAHAVKYASFQRYKNANGKT